MYQFKGLIYSIGETKVTNNNGKMYYEREVIVQKNSYNEMGDISFSTFPKFTFKGEQNCKLLDTFKVNDIVDISFNVNGVNYTNKQNQPANFTQILAYKIEKVNINNTANTTATQNAMPTYQNPLQTPAPSATSYAAPIVEDDDLPF